jgi:hypothetical protein
LEGLVTCLRKASGIEDSAGSADVSEFAHDFDAAFRRNSDPCCVRNGGQIRNRLDAGYAREFLPRGMDGVDVAREAQGTTVVDAA